MSDEEATISDFERRTKRRSTTAWRRSTRRRARGSRRRATERSRSARPSRARGWRWSLVPAGAVAATRARRLARPSGRRRRRRCRAVGGARRSRDSARRGGPRDARRGARVLRLARGAAGVRRCGRQRRLMRSVSRRGARARLLLACERARAGAEPAGAGSGPGFSRVSRRLGRRGRRVARDRGVGEGQRCRARTRIAEEVRETSAEDEDDESE